MYLLTNHTKHKQEKKEKREKKKELYAMSVGIYINKNKW